jgi:hypothetical protein
VFFSLSLNKVARATTHHPKELDHPSPLLPKEETKGGAAPRPLMRLSVCHARIGCLPHASISRFDRRANKAK